MWTTAVRNLEITQGQTYEKEWTFTQGGVAVDMTGWTGAAQIRNKAGTLLADLTTANGGVVITAATGKVKIVLTSAETVLVTETESDPHLWDIELYASASRTEKPLRGYVICHKTATEVPT